MGNTFNPVMFMNISNCRMLITENKVHSCMDLLKR